MRRRELAEKHSRALGFEPRDATRWLAPLELVRTAYKVLLAGAFAAYADKRELQQGFDANTVELDESDDLWLDFVADLGDGFDATYSVASVVARPELTVTEPGSATQHRLPAGQLLVFGGDEVYPASSAGAYEDRTTGPYRAALPADPSTPVRKLVAIPGNHDWYDGLTSFLRTFTQKRVFGNWETVQDRSYFVARLPHRWWLVGLDTQLAANVDEPQLRYLSDRLSADLEPGDAVIVCTATPAWVHTETKHDPDAFNTLHYVERNFLRRRRSPAKEAGELASSKQVAEVRLWLTGDSHHYARYEEQPPAGEHSGYRSGAPDATPTQFITCGLGGAYLGGTHDLPDDLTLPPPGSRMRDADPVPRRFRLTGPTYPSREDSRKQAWYLAALGRRNVLLRNPGFGGFMAGVHIFLLLVLALLFVVRPSGPAATGDAVAAPADEVRTAVSFAWVVVAVVLALSVVLALVRSVKRVRARRRTLAWPTPSVARAVRHVSRSVLSAVLLWLPQLGLACVSFVLAVAWWQVDHHPLSDPVVAVLIAGGIGFFAGSWCFALYVRSADGGQVADWQMSGQAIEDHKGFLRLHVTKDAVTVYPLIIDTVCRDWATQDQDDGTARPVPLTAPAVRLLEAPIRVSRAGFGPGSQGQPGQGST